MIMHGSGYGGTYMEAYMKDTDEGESQDQWKKMPPCQTGLCTRALNSDLWCWTVYMTFVYSFPATSCVPPPLDTDLN